MLSPDLLSSDHWQMLGYVVEDSACQYEIFAALLKGHFLVFLNRVKWSKTIFSRPENRRLYICAKKLSDK